MQREHMQKVGIGLLGILIGGAAAVMTHPRWEAWAGNCSSCHSRSSGATVGSECPAHFENGGVVITDPKRADALRLAMRDGIYRPWFELGRAPTPEEIGYRLRRDRAST